jgi:hypothetical protein
VAISVPQQLPTSALAAPSAALRVAVSADGNEHDCDDVTSTAMAVAILARAGFAGNLVYYGHSDHIWSTAGSCAGNSNREELMRVSSQETARLWGGFNPGVFINARAQTAAAVQALTAAVNASTAGSPLVIIAAGPMEVVGRALSASNPAARAHVTIVSHSVWNDTHADTDHGGWSWNELASLGAKLHKIRDQNQELQTAPSRYFWARDSSDPKIRWLWDRHIASGLAHFDPSDAGMAYWLVTGGTSGGDEDTTPEKLASFLSG